MPVNVKDIQYRGDAQDVQELLTTYRVGDYLTTFEENRKKQEQGVREKLLKDGIRLSDRLSPRIYRLFNEVCARLEIAAEAEVFCLPETSINAFAMLDVQEKGVYTLIAVTAGALENLGDAELKSILGHELGHFLCGSNRLMSLLNMDKDNPALTVLPPFGESLFLRWRKKAELSADRIGLIAGGDFASTARGLMKAAFGLSEKNLNLDLAALMAQIDEIKGHPELMASTFASHPLLPIRLKALELFSRSEKARRNGYKADGELLADADLENGVDALVTLTSRRPQEGLDLAVMRSVALGGALLLGADADVDNEEIKVLIQILHRYFTDEPEREIVTDRAQAEEGLKQALADVRKLGDPNAKGFILSRLADIALADGALMDEEGAVILEVAQQLEFPPKVAYQVMIGAAQAVGFRMDAKLNRIANELRQSLQIGFGRRKTEA